MFLQFFSLWWFFHLNTFLLYWSKRIIDPDKCKHFHFTWKKVLEMNQFMFIIRIHFLLKVRWMIESVHFHFLSFLQRWCPNICRGSVPFHTPIPPVGRVWDLGGFFAPQTSGHTCCILEVRFHIWNKAFRLWELVLSYKFYYNLTRIFSW